MAGAPEKERKWEREGGRETVCMCVKKRALARECTGERERESIGDFILFKHTHLFGLGTVEWCLV